MIKVKDQITFKNVSYKIDNQFFFKDLSFNLSTNGITIILGPNGAGKSLLTKIIKGLIKPENGNLSIFLNNKTPSIGYLSQNITFLRRNVFKNLSYPIEIKGFKKNQIEKIVKKLLDDFQFSGKEKISARRLSKGNKQYLSFIRTLVTQPELLILDEPSSNLDMDFTKKIEEYLLHRKKKIKIIMVTHDLFQAKRLADEILFINEGKLVELSKKEDFLKSSNPVVKRFLKGSLF